jgi:hypothetical protein
MSEVLHLGFNPSSNAWIGDLQTLSKRSSIPLVRERSDRWAEFRLGEISLAIATRLAIVTQIELRLQSQMTLLADEVRRSGKLDYLLDRFGAFHPESKSLVFEICAGVDACFFEWRSLYELLVKFAKVFCRRVLGIKLHDSKLTEILSSSGLPTNWVNRLKDHRELFFHETAPWIALEVLERSPLKCSFVIMKENLTVLDDPAKYVQEKELVIVSNALRGAVIAVREWLKRELQTLEETHEGTV